MYGKYRKQQKQTKMSRICLFDSSPLNASKARMPAFIGTTSSELLYALHLPSSRLFPDRGEAGCRPSEHFKPSARTPGRTISVHHNGIPMTTVMASVNGQELCPRFVHRTRSILLLNELKRDELKTKKT